MGLKDELAKAAGKGEKAAKDIVAGGEKAFKTAVGEGGKKAEEIKEKVSIAGKELVEGAKKAETAVEDKIKDIKK